MAKRRAGVLLHVTSLPGDHGIGDLGPVAHSFLDWMRTAELDVWQMLPLGPPGPGDSPYLARSTFAGNPLCIATEPLRELGLLGPEDLTAGRPAFGSDRVDHAAARAWKERLLDRAYGRFVDTAAEELRGDFASFRQREASWLDDWTLYAALKPAHGDQSWTEWPGPLRRHEAGALAAARVEFGEAIERAAFAQWSFDRQWRALRDAAHARGIRLFGDLPIYVAHDSADVWARPELFLLDAFGKPQVVAGVPPDAFSEDGQLWGNPLYDWRRHERESFAWWVARVRHQLARFDLVRIDHFRGLAGYWEVPAGASSAKDGQWRKGPGAKLLRALSKALDPEARGLPLCAEDLGVITPDVEELRQRFDLPGMKVLQFALGAPDTAGDPRTHGVQHHVPRQVVYPGTHDNDTAEGWFSALPAEQKEWALDAVGRGPEWVSWKLARMAYLSVAELAVVPMQDLLGLGSPSRMNLPGEADGNWAWRFRPDQVPAGLAIALTRLAQLSGRSRG